MDENRVDVPGRQTYGMARKRWVFRFLSKTASDGLPSSVVSAPSDDR